MQLRLRSRRAAKRSGEPLLMRLGGPRIVQVYQCGICSHGQFCCNTDGI